MRLRQSSALQLLDLSCHHLSESTLLFMFPRLSLSAPVHWLDYFPLFFMDTHLATLPRPVVPSIRQVSIPSIITRHPAVILCSSTNLPLPVFQWLRCLRLSPQSISPVPSPKQIKLLLMLQPVCILSLFLGCIHAYFLDK